MKRIGDHLPENIYTAFMGRRVNGKQLKASKQEMKYFTLCYELHTGARGKDEGEGYRVHSELLRAEFGSRYNEKLAKYADTYGWHKKISKKTRVDNEGKVIKERYYKLTPKCTEQLERCLSANAKADTGTGRIVDLSGKTMTVRGAGLKREDKEGKRAVKVKGQKIGKKLRVNLLMLQLGHELLGNVHEGDWKEGRFPEVEAMIEQNVAERNKSVPLEQYVLECKLQVADIINRTDKDSEIYQQYEQDTAGRWYEYVSSVGTKRHLIRELALHGTYSYDMESSCLAILLALASYDVSTVYLKDYLANKTARRQQWAEEAGVQVRDIKRFITASGFGMNKNGDTAKDLAGERHKDVVAVLDPLLTEIDSVSKLVYKEAMVVANATPRKNKGYVVNMLGKRKKTTGEDGKKVPRAKILAFLVQGAEAYVLSKIMEKYRTTHILHDGFTVSEEIDVSELEEYVLQSTGMNLRYGRE